jgi:hypothetical protein
MDDARLIAVEALQPLGHCLVNLDGGDRGGPVDQSAKRCTVTGSDLECALAQLHIVESPRQHLVADELGPTCRATPPPVQQVHRHDVTPFSRYSRLYFGRYEVRRAQAFKNMPRFIENQPRFTVRRSSRWVRNTGVSAAVKPGVRQIRLCTTNVGDALHKILAAKGSDQ